MTDSTQKPRAENKLLAAQSSSILSGWVRRWLQTQTDRPSRRTGFIQPQRMPLNRIEAPSLLRHSPPVTVQQISSILLEPAAINRFAGGLVTRFQAFTKSYEPKPLQIQTAPKPDLLMANQTRLNETGFEEAAVSPEQRLPTFREMMEKVRRASDSPTPSLPSPPTPAKPVPPRAADSPQSRPPVKSGLIRRIVRVDPSEPADELGLKSYPEVTSSLPETKLTAVAEVQSGDKEPAARPEHLPAAEMTPPVPTLPAPSVSAQPSRPVSPQTGEPASPLGDQNRPGVSGEIVSPITGLAGERKPAPIRETPLLEPSQPQLKLPPSGFPGSSEIPSLPPAKPMTPAGQVFTENLEVDYLTGTVPVGPTNPAVSGLNLPVEAGVTHATEEIPENLAPSAVTPARTPGEVTRPELKPARLEAPPLTEPDTPAPLLTRPQPQPPAAETKPPIPLEDHQPRPTGEDVAAYQQTPAAPVRSPSPSPDLEEPALTVGPEISETKYSSSSTGSYEPVSPPPAVEKKAVLARPTRPETEALPFLNQLSRWRPRITADQVTSHLITQGWRFKRKAGSSSADAESVTQAAVGLDRPGEAGEPLAHEPRRVMEQTLGRDFGDVRVHTASLSPLNVQAAARGRDVYLETGQDHFDTPGSLAVLGHELTHVAQQGFARPLAQTATLPQAQQPARVDSDEAEAESAERSIMNFLSPSATTFSKPATSFINSEPAGGDTPSLRGGGSPELPLASATSAPAAPGVQFRSLEPLEPGDQATIEDIIAPDEAPASEQIDLKRLARKIYPLIKQRLAIERQRMPG